MKNKFLIAMCIFSLAISAQAAEATKKKTKKTVTTTTEEVDENGKVTKKTEKVETEDDTEEANPLSKEEPKSFSNTSGLPTINEDWYTLWGIGWGSSSYSEVAGDAYEDLENSAGADRSSTTSLDLFGFYWPLSGHHTMLGVAYNYSSDVIELQSGTDARVSTGQIGFSAHHFFGENIGHGWYLRGDLGFAIATAEISNGSVSVDNSTDVGLGAIVGGGYGFSIGDETRLLIGLNYKMVPKLKFDGAEHIKGRVTSLNFGFLF